MHKTNALLALAFTATLVMPRAFANCTTQTFVQSARTAAGVKRVVTADFNGDQKSDIAAVTSDRGVVVFLNQNGVLDSGTAFSSTKTNLIDLITGDFNADGKSDLLALDSLGTTLVVLLGDGAGSFTVSELAAPLPMGFSLIRLAAGDFDSDGDTDFVAVTSGTSGVAPLFFSNGNGTFTSPGGLTFQTKASSLLATVDFDGDGKIDIVNGYSNDSLMEVRIGDGAGNFTYAGVLPSAASPSSIALSDLSGDGRKDVVSTNYDAGTFTVTLAAMSGYNPGVNYYSGHFVNNSSKPIDVAIADFNNDGKKDIIVANSQEGTITLFRGNGDGSFVTTPAYFLLPNQYASSPRSLVVADIDLDGRSDVVTADSTSGSLTLMTNSCGVTTIDMTLDHPVITTGQNAKVTIRKRSRRRQALLACATRTAFSPRSRSTTATQSRRSRPPPVITTSTWSTSAIRITTRTTPRRNRSTSRMPRRRSASASRRIPQPPGSRRCSTSASRRAPATRRPDTCCARPTVVKRPIPTRFLSRRATSRTSAPGCTRSSSITSAIRRIRRAAPGFIHSRFKRPPLPS
jgi:hypothetical protein